VLSLETSLAVTLSNLGAAGKRRTSSVNTSNPKLRKPIGGCDSWFLPDDHDPLLKAREGAALLGCSEPTFWRRVADGTLPQPIRIGGMSRWPRSEILSVINAAKAARSSEGSP